ncbi:MAG TPA: hypothetical protein VMW42_09720 [Desulfatiglandales bacterium]|nr:hypothetical protein [Desulfatiglandales bacterium]
MNIQMGGQVFANVQIPLLWGSRAVIQDMQGRLSIIDLGGNIAKLEIVGDKPAPGVEFRPLVEGFEILDQGSPLYIYSPSEKSLRSKKLGLPDCQISPEAIRVGTSIFSGNVVGGSGVGIIVTTSGIGMGAPLPKTLAELII